MYPLVQASSNSGKKYETTRAFRVIPHIPARLCHATRAAINVEAGYVTRGDPAAWFTRANWHPREFCAGIFRLRNHCTAHLSHLENAAR